jgi:hypothetical protein
MTAAGKYYGRLILHNPGKSTHERPTLPSHLRKTTPLRSESRSNRLGAAQAHPGGALNALNRFLQSGKVIPSGNNR